MKPALNPEVVAELRAMDGTGAFFRELAGLFHKNAPALLDKIKQGLASDDAGAATGGANQLKSSAGGLGADEVREICGHLGECAACGDLTAARALVSGLDEALVGVLKLIEAILAEAA